MVERYFLSCMILEKDIQNYIWFILLKILIVIQIQFIYLEMFLKQSTKFFSFENDLIQQIFFLMEVVKSQYKL